MSAGLLLILVAAPLCLWLTGILRRYALSRNLLDVPNARSSHRLPTPRGGGLAIVLVVLGMLPVLWLLGWLEAGALIGLWGSGLLVALVGWLDDHGHVRVSWRLLTHFAAAGWGLVWLGGLPPLPMMGAVWDMGWAGHLLAMVYLVWVLNLYNFMDGIDGIAGIEAVTVCVGAVLLSWLAVGQAGLPAAGVTGVLAAACAGFLFWNFPRARIFMGDGGSGFVGLMLGLLSIQAAWVAPELFWAWVILLGVFVVDATLTLVRRVVRGVPFHQAHRSHAYQHAARRLGRHPPVSLAVGALNLFWLLPLGVLVVLGWLDGVLGVLLAYLPLAWLAWRFRAGVGE
ncbi:putative group 4 glycosyl transferase [Ectothiorhodospira sp. PHS-1]|uniref:MraY family glycosyltransferase n=1 Tax=Ectothiorhodospira sp. PHS-1 TaxID=519989 RepID=UPI00024A8A12|nr:glycosyltransferase family 4 protein [Ectothiorhodospira sp. PHS-1]EHQ53689.1 putative group 4 glycosyl transferase [Ectothiorhodospira sp. PHS-1]